MTVPGLHCEPLTESTWPAFADLVERHNGVWGGCWCMGFHSEGVGKGCTPEGNRAAKEVRVREGRAHATRVFDGDDCVGWCQFGSCDELPRTKNTRGYAAGLVDLPDWRITCFFVDKTRRGRGIAAVALAGALEQIAHLGGGLVESYPEDMEGRTLSGSFLHNSRVAMFEAQGFERTRRIGKHRWVVARTGPPAGS